MKNATQYKFMNNETDNLLSFLTILEDDPDPKKTLEDTRHRLAVEHGIYIGSIYYIQATVHNS